ncbi:hypothetical protein [Falsiroseomonas tokyonensis]|uniref:Uncharacterized protein n=1 Tax=Falsiroseomonas tokyonensis TaxID=430521 RepID=A0ABV7BV50_9PROT|nr:hypothetical protein [Falsiroseomonas tokyonensis]MBU8538366.1 hypothetical protein [Falsiroseomonas tokyonensis]
MARNVTSLAPKQAALWAAAREQAEAHRNLFANNQSLHDAAREQLAADCAAEGRISSPD